MKTFAFWRCVYTIYFCLIKYLYNKDVHAYTQILLSLEHLDYYLFHFLGLAYKI